MAAIPEYPYEELARGREKRGTCRISKSGVAALKVRGCVAHHMLSLAQGAAEKIFTGGAAATAKAGAAANGRAMHDEPRSFAAAEAPAPAASGAFRCISSLLQSCGVAASTWAGVAAAEEPPWGGGEAEAARLMQLLSDGFRPWLPQPGGSRIGTLECLRWQLPCMLQRYPQLLRLPVAHVQRTLQTLRSLNFDARVMAVAAGIGAREPQDRVAEWRARRFQQKTWWAAEYMIVRTPELLTDLAPGQLSDRLAALQQTCDFTTYHLWTAVNTAPQLLLANPRDLAARVAWLRSPATSVHGAKVDDRCLAEHTHLMDMPSDELSCGHLAWTTGSPRCTASCGLSLCRANGAKKM